ncbi:MAG: ubiquitin-conjugating enzyme E2, partial [Planctomycetota bacterium]
MRKSPRQRRLESDYKGIRELRDESTILKFLASGEPPQKYRLIFEGKGIYRDSRGEVKVTDHHECLIEFGAAYPRLVPNLAWQTPIFHPNISNNGVVCLGGYGTHWVPSLTISELCGMLWDMIRFENFDTESPYNREAAVWAKQQQPAMFPIDQRSIRDKISNPHGIQAKDGIEII